VTTDVYKTKMITDDYEKD